MDFFTQLVHFRTAMIRREALCEDNVWIERNRHSSVVIGWCCLLMKAPRAGSVVTLDVLRCSLQGLALASESKSTSQSHQHGTESRFKRLCLTLLGKWKPDPPEIPNCTYHTNLRRHRPPAQQIWYGRYHTIPLVPYHVMPNAYNLQYHSIVAYQCITD